MPVSKRAFALSMLIHTIVFALGFLAMILIDSHPPLRPTRLIPITERTIARPPKWLIAKQQPGGGGGGCGSIGDSNGRTAGDGRNGFRFAVTVASIAPVQGYSIEPEHTRVNDVPRRR